VTWTGKGQSLWHGLDRRGTCMRVRFRLKMLERLHQENLGLVWRVMLKLALSSCSFSMCTVLVADSCEQCIETFGFHKIHLMLDTWRFSRRKGLALR
jgi:hypothetical protein